jgi:hypothetical protein
MDVGMAAPNAQPSPFAVPIPQHPMGYASPGHSQQGPYSHVMSYGPLTYHPALLMQYRYASSMGGHPHYGHPDASWTPTPFPVPVPYTDTTPPVGSPVNHGRSTEGEGRVNTGSRIRHTDRLRNDALRSRQRRSSPTPEPLEVKNA